MPQWTNKSEPHVKKLLKLCDDGMTLQGMGDCFGISRERVRQILLMHGRQSRLPSGCVSTCEASKEIGCSDTWLIRNAELVQRGGTSVVRVKEVRRLKKLFNKSIVRKCAYCKKLMRVYPRKRGQKYRTYCGKVCREMASRVSLHIPATEVTRLSSPVLSRILSEQQKRGLIDFGKLLRWKDADALSGMTKMQFRFAVYRGLIRTRDMPEWGSREGKPYRAYSETDVLLARKCTQQVYGGNHVTSRNRQEARAVNQNKRPVPRDD